MLAMTIIDMSNVTSIIIFIAVATNSTPIKTNTILN